MGTKTLGLLIAGLACLSGQEKYSGPAPAKPDIPYLLRAQSLISIELAQARRDGEIYVIVGAGSSARTPQSEPAFLIDAREISPEQIELYPLEVKNGSREASFSTKSRKGSTSPLHLMVHRLGEHLYRIEPSEMLENGEYALTDDADSHVFCFAVY